MSPPVDEDTMTSKTPSIANRPAAVVGIILLVIAVVTYWDASHMKMRANYGMSASAASSKLPGVPVNSGFQSSPTVRRM